jgi:hypothetical protein
MDPPRNPERVTMTIPTRFKDLDSGKTWNEDITFPAIKDREAVIFMYQPYRPAKHAIDLAVYKMKGLSAAEIERLDIALTEYNNKSARDKLDITVYVLWDDEAGRMRLLVPKFVEIQEASKTLWTLHSKTRLGHLLVEFREFPTGSEGTAGVKTEAPEVLVIRTKK